MIAIERFRFMQALREFCFSGEYQQAQELRQALVTINFLVGVEADWQIRTAGRSTHSPNLLAQV